MDAVNVGAYHLSENPHLYEPQRSNNFELHVPGLAGIVRPGMLATDTNAAIPNADEILKLAVVSTNIPHFTQGIINVQRGNTEFKAAGRIQFGENQIVVNSLIGVNSKEILMAWQRLSGDPEKETVGLMSEYKKDAYLIEYDPSYNKIRQWIVKGCWVSGISETGYSNETNEKMVMTATIQYDKAYIDQSGNA